MTWNPELLSPGALEAGGAVVLVGNVFSGCLHEGPQLEFHAHHAQLHNVLFGHCPLATDDCESYWCCFHILLRTDCIHRASKISKKCSSPILFLKKIVMRKQNYIVSLKTKVE